jgi:hypothetical protein
MNSLVRGHERKNIFKEFPILRLDVLAQVMADFCSWGLIGVKRMGLWNHHDHGYGSSVSNRVIQDLSDAAFCDRGLDRVSVPMIKKQNWIRFLRLLVVGGWGTDEERPGGAQSLGPTGSMLSRTLRQNRDGADRGTGSSRTKP